MTDSKAHVELKNLPELRQKLERAATLTEQLDETLRQINNFQFDVELKNAKNQSS